MKKTMAELPEMQESTEILDSKVVKPTFVGKIKTMRTFSAIKLSHNELYWFNDDLHELSLMHLNGMFYVKIVLRKTKDLVCTPIQNVIFWN